MRTTLFRLSCIVFSLAFLVACGEDGGGTVGVADDGAAMLLIRSRDDHAPVRSRQVVQSDDAQQFILDPAFMQAVQRFDLDDLVILVVDMGRQLPAVFFLLGVGFSAVPREHPVVNFPSWISRTPLAQTDRQTRLD